MDYQPATELIRKAIPDTEAVYLFGSQARNDAHRASDADLAVLAATPLDALVRFDLQERFASRLRRSVDLVDRSSGAAAGLRSDRAVGTPASTKNAAASSTTSDSVDACMDDVVLNKASIIERCVRSIIELRMDELLACSSLALRTVP